MPRQRLRFAAPTPAARTAAGRADVAAFVGFVRLRDDLPSGVQAALRRRWVELGWGGALARGVDTTLLPVVVESIEAFDGLFDGVVRTTVSGVALEWEGYLSGAVRDFFRQGGRRAWIVPCGAPQPPPAGEAASDTALDLLIPGLVPSGDPVDSGDRLTWRGLGHLLGLPEVSLVCVPDLVACLGGEPPAPEPLPEPPVFAPVFEECAAVDLAPPEPALPRKPEAPRADVAERARWAAAVRAVRDWCSHPAHQLDVVLVIAPPLPLAKSPAERDLLAALTEEALVGPPAAGGIGSAWVQCAWPWVKGDTTRDRPGQLAPADGLLAGMLAASALERGTFRSLLGRRPLGVRACVPLLTAAAADRPRPVEPLDDPADHLCLVDRMCVIGAATDGIRLLSDVTLSPDPRWRPGGSSRLWAALRRSLRSLGEQFVFAPNGQATWRSMERAIEELLADWAAEGAFDDPREPGTVRCDRGTMSQADLDDGRLIVHVEVTPAQAIEGFEVVMSVVGGRVAFSGGEAA